MKKLYPEAGRGAAFFGEGSEQQPAANIAGGVLHDGQVQTLSLLPVARDIVQILGIGADLLEQSPARFDVCQILLALILSATFFQQAMLAPDAFERFMTDGQIEFADQAAGAKCGKGLAQRDQLRFGVGRGFLRLMMAGAGKRKQTRRAALLIATQPLAHGGHGRGEQSSRRFDATLLGALDQPQTMVIGVFHFTHQIEIADRGSHDAAILPAARRPALPPAGRPSPSASFRSNTSTPPGGYDVSRLFQDAANFAQSAIFSENESSCAY